MALSKRERLVATVAAAAMAVLLADRFVVTPILDRSARVDAESQAKTAEMERAQELLARQLQMGQRWKDMIAGTLKADPAEAQSRAQHALVDWAHQAGLNLVSVKAERMQAKGSLGEITFQAVAIGPMSAVSQFLWRCQTEVLPLRVKEIQLGSRKDGADDLSLTMRFSTLYLAEARPAAKAAGEAKASQGES
jgi:hypothetical protein